MRPLKQILLAIASICGLAAPAAAAPTEADVAMVRDYVGKNRAYSPAARAEALRAVERLPGLIGEPARFELEAAAIAALADNGHSALLPPQWASRYPRSPVHLGLFADGLYVIAAPAEHVGLLRSRVIAINGHPWRDVRARLCPLPGRRAGLPRPVRPPVHGDAGSARRRRLRTRSRPAAADAGGGERPPRHRDDRRPAHPAPRARRPSSATRTCSRAPACSTPAQRPLYLRQPDQASRLAFPDGLDGAYLQLKAIRGLHFDAWLERALEDLRARRPRNIVVDLRFNMGGDLNLARDFMRALPALAEGGRVYAITSGRTFSAAISSLGYLKQAAGDRLTIVGEPIGDRLEFWAEGNILELPGLGAMMLYADERHNYMTGCPEPDCHRSIRDHPIRVRSLQPDIAAPLGFADFAAGRDPAMEAIAADIARRR